MPHKTHGSRVQAEADMVPPRRVASPEGQVILSGRARSMGGAGSLDKNQRDGRIQPRDTMA